MRSLHFPGRSPVHARHAMVATSHPLASEAAIRVLREGGNAVDAALTATALLCVVEHPMTGIGGDCFALLAKPGQPPIGLNASGRAPMAATQAWYAERGITTITQTSPHAVTVPGAIDGWARLSADHGTRPLAALLQPAIAAAREGFVIAPRVSIDWAGATTKLAANPAAAAHLLVGGRAPRAGEVMRLPALARTLERIAEGGRDAFYRGALADEMVATLQAVGGLHTKADFERQSSSYVTPIATRYNGVDLYELPPNNHGVVALILLRLLERLGSLGSDPASAERFHVMLEAARLAYAMRDAFVADPEMAPVDVAHMLSDATIDALAARIDRSRRRADLGPMPKPAGSDTVYLTVVDKDGLAVSFINSLFSDFGSGITTPDSAIVLHNRAQGFVLEAGHPNAIAPGKRPLHTLIPAMAYRDGRLWASFGVMGGAFQPMGHTYILTNMVDYGLDPQQALDCPRVFFEGEQVLIEDSVGADVRAGLAARGHDVGVRPLPWGGGQIITIDAASGVLTGASDHRKDGFAIGY